MPIEDVLRDMAAHDRRLCLLRVADSRSKAKNVNAALAEDIYSSIRAFLTGRRLIHDHSIVSFELVPTRARHWFFQRKRWAQGWQEVTLASLRTLLASLHLTLGQKRLWL